MTPPREPSPRVIGHLKRLRADIVAVLAIPPSCIDDARATYRAERERAIHAQLAATPLRELRRFSEGRIRYDAIEAAGIRTVGAVIATSASRLESIRGVGSKSSERIRSAAKRLENDARRGLGVRFDIESRPREQTKLLNALRSLNEARRSVRPLSPGLEAATLRVNADFADARVAASTFRRMFAGARRKERSRAALERIIEFLSEPETAALESEIADIRRRPERPRRGRAAIWDEYATQAATCNGLLAEIEGHEAGPGRRQSRRGHPRRESLTGIEGLKTGLVRRRRRRAEMAARNVGPTRPDGLGDRHLLPANIAERITSFDLDVTLLGASLRGYQDFGAKFALVQKRTILGDEMGLGKTIEALAVLCHLRSRGATHFLVVCPASVLANWENEIRRHSQLPTPVRLHGHLRNRLLSTWIRNGGVAITTFDTLRLLDIPNIDIAAVVVDEAHYVKNPEALRTSAVRACLERSQYALLMSGTPLENRLEDFQTLVSQIEAGGVGLNIQAASVVIVAEPQWKPSTEEQAIARSHRMGQIRPVEVHRPLTENSVDEHMLAILARKSALFASYIRPSAMKDATPAAVDSSAATTSQSTHEEQIIESERRRLGLAA